VIGSNRPTADVRPRELVACLLSFETVTLGGEMAYIRYSAKSNWYVFEHAVDSGAEPQLAIWHRDHRSTGPLFSLSDVRSMIQSNDLTRIPGYESKDHQQLLEAMNRFVIDEQQSGK
jgi:hypothetical protein